MNIYGCRSILTTPFFGVEALQISRHETEIPYYRITGKDSVIICVLDEDGCFVMVRQFRPSLGFHTLEFPAGAMEDGESSFAAARRELAEEAGIFCPLLPLGHTFSLMMNRTNIRDHVFVGMLPDSISDHQPELGVETIRLPREELLQRAQDGTYLQLAGLGVLQLAGGVLEVDMWRSSLKQIEQSFRTHLSLRETAN